MRLDLSIVEQSDGINQDKLMKGCPVSVQFECALTWANLYDSSYEKAEESATQVEESLRKRAVSKFGGDVTLMNGYYRKTVSHVQVLNHLKLSEASFKALSSLPIEVSVTLCRKNLENKCYSFELALLSKASKSSYDLRTAVFLFLIDPFYNINLNLLQDLVHDEL